MTPARPRGTRPPTHDRRRSTTRFLFTGTSLLAAAAVLAACASAPAHPGTTARADSPGIATTVNPATLPSPVTRATQPEHVAQPMSAAPRAAERIDTAAIRRIREEGMQRSQVMEIASWLTDIHGPRLTNSPQHRAAAEWAVRTMRGWGVANPHLEPFANFGRGWSNERVSVHVTAPQQYPVIAYAAAWTPGTNGRVIGEAVALPLNELRTRADLEQWRGRLRGKFVLASGLQDFRIPFEPPARRHSDEALAQLENPPQAQGGPGRGRPGFGGQQPQLTLAQIREMVRTPAPNDSTPLSNAARTEFLAMEGVHALVTTAQSRGNYGVFTVQTGAAASRVATDAALLPQVVIAPEHYGRIVRTIDKGMPVSLEVEVRNTFHDVSESFNVIGELPGTDRRDEIVMLGAHFDSWHAGTGATDNASGSAVMLEAMRILKATGVPLRRTVRLALWGGEEQGLIGSREHVAKHLAERGANGARKPAYDKFSVYFNMDNGTGAFRGVYAQGNEAAIPVFREWIAPLRDLGITMVAPGNTGSTDHVAFDAVGLPGFQFVQDPVEYGTRTHHSNQDTFERLIEDDLKKNATIVAAFVFIAANRDELFPRKPAVNGAGR